VLRLPEPMLARSGPIPAGSGWVFEPKLDGFRCPTT
jgi:ATP-dependent DNA ligase